MAERPEYDLTRDPLDRGLAAAFGPGPASRGALDTPADSIGPLPLDAMIAGRNVMPTGCNPGFSHAGSCQDGSRWI